MTKVALVDEDGRVETLWATHVGDDLFRLENSPFFAYGYSWHDVVRAPFSEATGFATAVGVVQKSGHRTVRLILDPDDQGALPADAVLAGFQRLGCSYEGARSRLLSIDVPPDVSLQAVA